MAKSEQRAHQQLNTIQKGMQEVSPNRELTREVSEQHHPIIYITGIDAPRACQNQAHYWFGCKQMISCWSSVRGRYQKGRTLMGS